MKQVYFRVGYIYTQNIFKGSKQAPYYKRIHDIIGY